MKRCTERASGILLGIGIGLILSLLLSGWFVRLVIGLVLLVLGCLLSDHN